MNIGYHFRFTDKPAKTDKSIVNFINSFRKLFGSIIKSHKTINALCPKIPSRNCF